MALESATYVNQLDPANPASTDPVSQGQAQIQLVKQTLVTTLPNFNAPLQSTPAAIDATVTGWNAAAPAVSKLSLQDSTETDQGYVYSNATADGGAGLMTLDGTNYVYVNDTLVQTPKSVQIGGNAVIAGSLQVPTITGATNFTAVPTIGGTPIPYTNIQPTSMATSMRLCSFSASTGDGINPITAGWGIKGYIWVPVDHTLNTYWFYNSSGAAQMILYVSQQNGTQAITQTAQNAGAPALTTAQGAQMYVWYVYGDGAATWASLNVQFLRNN